jgi:hypothetical protein
VPNAPGISKIWLLRLTPGNFHNPPARLDLIGKDGDVRLCALLRREPARRGSLLMVMLPERDHINAGIDPATEAGPVDKLFTIPDSDFHMKIWDLVPETRGRTLIACQINWFGTPEVQINALQEFVTGLDSYTQAMEYVKNQTVLNYKKATAT